MVRVPRRVGVIAALVLLAASTPVRAQSTAREQATDRLISARHLERAGVPLDGKWLFTLGDNPSWSLATFDDSEWTTLSPSEPLPDSIVARIKELEASGKPAIGWFRLHLAPERSIIRKPLALDFRTRGAASVYVDARKILELGELDRPGATARIETPRLPSPILFDSTSVVLAVRHHMGSAVDVQRHFQDSFLFKATLRPGEAIATRGEARRFDGGLLLGIFGLFLAVGILHFVLFVLLRHPISNLHYAAFAGQFAVLPLAMYLAEGTESVQLALLLSNIGRISLTLSVLALLTFLYTSFYDRLPAYYRVFVGLTAFCIGLQLLPVTRVSVTAWIIGFAVFAIEMIRVLTIALWQKKDGAKVIALGFGFTLVLLVYPVLIDVGVVQNVAYAGRMFWFAWLGLAIAPSMHLANDFARTSTGFRKLSAELELKVAERTVQLDEAREAAEAASRTKSQFLANMSHELRTPLNAVIGYSEMLMEEAEDAGHADYIPDLKKIHGSGRHLLGLINDILDLSKIESGRMELYFETFEVEPMIEEVASTITPLIARNGNRLSIDVAHDVGNVRLDQVKVRQILFNLLSNASKFTENGTITLSARKVAERIVLSVSDTGIGMTPEQMDKVFQPFIQADASTSKKYGGTGLGLAITQKFCEMMNGEIALDSVPGHGTTFTVTLPTDADAYAAAMAQSPSELPMPAQGETATILVIDDDAAAREMLMRMLSKEGYRVLLAASGDEGLRVALEEKPDVITLDVLMTGLDGWGVLTRLKADEATADIPVLVVTVIDDRNLGFALGAADYLTKPVERERLADALRRVRADARAGPVLIVDDDETVREMLRRILQKDGWETVEAENGRVALDAMVNHTPCVVLLDLMMPEMDGFTFIDSLADRGVGGLAPIIVLTAKTLTEADRQRLQGAVTQVLHKGEHSSADLLAELRRAAFRQQPNAVNNWSVPNQTRQ